MTIDGFVEIAIAFIGLLCAIITYVVVPYFNAKTTKEQREDIAFWTEIAVNAAEQVYKERGMGIYKKADVLDFVNGFLEKKGWKLTQEQVDMLIEAFVKRLNQAQIKPNE